MDRIEWSGLYAESWGNDLVPEAYAHPAKYSRGLIRQIYAYMLAEGMIAPGDVIGDPFGGQAGGALDAMTNGLHWRGVELEAKFQKVGQGMDCPGFDKEFYRRYNQRGNKWHELGICPDCKVKLNGFHPIHHWFGKLSRPVPSQEPHHFRGNIEIWQTKPWAKGTAVLAQGDSRNFAGIVGWLSGAVSSPPFQESGADDFRPYGGIAEKRNQGGVIGKVYGSTPGQLGSMPPGDLSAVITSPPYATNTVHGGSGLKQHSDNDKGAYDYGDSPANLGHMKPGDLDAAISSPPYADTIENGDGPGARWDFATHRNGDKVSSDASYGRSPGQVGRLDGVISSSPFEKQVTGGGIAAALQGKSDYSSVVKPSTGSINQGYQQQAQSKGNLANDQGDTFWAASREIVAQTYAALKPGGYAAWVCGDFVRKGKRVRFGEQWLALCEACGFEPVTWAIAWKTERHGTQTSLFGDVEMRTDRVSFFRRLANEKNPDAAVLNEDVIFVRRPM